jgi:hypothetical protein
MPTAKLSRAAARRLSIHTQGLDGHWRLPKGKEGAAQIVERLGYVQIDTISVIERAHDHVIQTRYPGYHRDMLGELLSVDRRVFEYWTHAAAYVPMQDFRYYLARMVTAHTWKREADWRRDNESVVQEVLARIRAEGAMASANFKHEPGQRGPWWDWKPAKMALEVLFNSGELMVSARRGFQRVYDLAERVLPSHIDTHIPTKDEAALFFAHRALATLGLATVPQVRKLYQNHGALNALNNLIDTDQAVPLQIEGLEETYYALTSTLGKIPRRLANHIHLLSPFDNLTIDRDRLQALFDFYYRIECYTPAAKRQYGYFTLPILWNGAFIGRLDPKAARQDKTLIIRNLALEPAFKAYDALIPPLTTAIKRFALFNGCPDVLLEQTTPRKIKAPLVQALKSL